VSRKLIIALILLCPVAGVVAGFNLLPRRYTQGERLNQTNIFWNDKEAFFFLSTSTIGKSSNILSEKLQRTRYGYLEMILNGRSQFYEYGLKAYRLLPSGELQSLTLPEDATMFGNWTLQDGRLQVTPVETGYNRHPGFRWDGEKFVAVAAQPKPQVRGGETKLSPDDTNDDDDRDSGILSRAARKTFKEAGWHYKELAGFVTDDTQSTLTMNLGTASFNLSVTSFPQPDPDSRHFDMLTFGMKSLKIAKSDQPQTGQTLWSQNGWQPISKSEFEQRAKRTGTVQTPLTIWMWLAILLFATLWRFGALGHGLLTLLGMKGRVLKNMATSYSFPPATPAQFPGLDTTALERYSREFESMGFVRLLDFSLVSDAALQIPSFCRLYAHTKYHCFGEISQIFPRGKAPLPLACSLQSMLQEGWALTFSDRKPLAAGSLVRRRKALSVSMPGTDTSALLQAFLQMRDNVCQDLGISVVREDTLEAYIAKVQRSVTEMRDAVKEKNFATAVSHVYYRKLALLRTREEYTWLGDYPKEAERRKQGFPVAARAL
jgi:hypothetical protein